jgi:hypothetical protein
VTQDEKCNDKNGACLAPKMLTSPTHSLPPLFDVSLVQGEDHVPTE